MAFLGRRRPFPPIIKTMIQYGPPPEALGRALVVSAVALATADRAYFVKKPATIIYGKYLSGAVVPGPIGKQKIVTFESVRRAARRATDIFIPFIQTIRPPDRIKIPPLVQTDPRAPERQRVHNDYVAAILNSLITQRELIRVPGQLARGDWKLGYVPTTPGNWDSPAPTTVEDALDRLGGEVTSLTTVDGGTWS